MPLSDFVQVTIVTNTAGVTQAGFGVPLILSPRPSWVERVRSYTDLDGMVTDGFTTATPEYKAAAAMFAQNPRPEKVLVGRAALKPTQRFVLTPTAVNSATYKFTLITPAGVTHTVSIDADSSTSATEIVTALTTAVDALSLDITCSGTTTLTLTADNAGDFFSLEIDNPALLSVVQNHADPGVATDLAAIKLENDTWYALITLFNSKAVIEAAAAWVESNKKLYVAQTQDTPVIATSSSGTDDVAEALKNSAYVRTALAYHPKTAAFLDAAWAGKCLPFDPGSETWNAKLLAGVPAVALTSTHQSNAEAKNCNYFYTVGGQNVTTDGRTSSGEFIDIVRGRDWLEARLQERCFAKLINSKKIPYTDAGIAIIEAEVRAQLQEAVAIGLLSDNPAPTVTVPLASSVSSADKTARILRNVKFDAVLAGAIHEIRLSGTISV